MKKDTGHVTIYSAGICPVVDFAFGLVVLSRLNDRGVY